MFGQAIQKLFGALVIVSLVLTGVGSTRGAAARETAAPPVDVAATSRGGTDMAAPQAATPIDPGPYGQYSPKLAADSAGNLFAVWQDHRDGQGRSHIRFAQRPAGGAWQPSVKLDPASTLQWNPTLAVDGSGNAYAAWQDRRSGHDQIYFAARPAAGAWSAGQVISPTLASEPQDAPALAVNRRGEALILWAQGRCCVNPTAVYAATRPAGGVWGAAQRIGQARSWGASLNAALDDWGGAYAIWLDPTSAQVSFAARPAGGTWSAARNIRDSATGNVMHLSLAVDSAGNAHAIWIDPRNGNDDVYAAYRPAGGPWSANVRVNDDATTKGQFLPHVAVDGAGNAIAFWGDLRRDLADLYAAVRYRGGGWGPNGLLLNWAVPGATSRAGLLAGSPASAPAQDTSESFQPYGGFAGSGANCGQQMAAAGAAGLAAAFAENVEYVFEATPSAGADYANVYYVAVGGTGAAAGLGPAQTGGGNACHGGNAVEGPVANSDTGDWSQLLEYGAGVLDIIDWLPGMSGLSDLAATYGAELIADQSAEPVDGAGDQESPPAGGGGGQGASPAGGQSLEDALAALAQQIADLMNQMVQQGYYTPQPSEIVHTTYSEWYVISLLSQSVYFNRPLTPEELQILLSHQQYLAAPPSAILTLYGQIQQVKPEWQVNIANLAGMTPEGFKEVQVQIAGIIAAQEQAAAAAAQQAAAQQAAENQQSGQGARPTNRPTTLLGTYANMLAFAEEAWEISQLDPTDPRVQAWLERQAAGVTPQQVTLVAIAQAFSKAAADPVLPHSGEFVHTVTPLTHPWPRAGLSLLPHLSLATSLRRPGRLGLDAQLRPPHPQRGRRLVGAGRWRRAGSASSPSTARRFTPSAGRFTAVISATTGITLTDRSGLVEGYFPLDGSAAAGRLRAISDRNGNTLRFAYDAQGRLQTVTDTLGRIITYAL